MGVLRGIVSVNHQHWVQLTTFAKAKVAPLPCATLSVAASGRTAMTTGTPSVSSPVTSASRVIP